MDKLSQLYDNRVVGLVSVTIILVIEHLQAMSYIRIAPNPDGESWSDSAEDVFDFLDDLALKKKGSTFKFLFVFYTVLVLVLFLSYILLNRWAHDWNASRDVRKSLPICLIDYILFGLVYVPMIYAYHEVQYCSEDETILPNDDIECFGETHMLYFQFGLAMLSLVVLVAAGIMPFLKNERNGVEKKWGNESYFSAIYKLQIAGLAVLVCPLQIPELGILMTIAIIAYLAVYEAYSELHIANVKMGLLFGQLWLFVCAKICEADGNIGAALLYLWIPFILGGYSLIHIKHLIVRRELKQLPIEK